MSRVASLVFWWSRQKSSDALLVLSILCCVSRMCHQFGFSPHPPFYIKRRHHFLTPNKRRLGRRQPTTMSSALRCTRKRAPLLTGAARCSSSSSLQQLSSSTSGFDDRHSRWKISVCCTNWFFVPRPGRRAFGRAVLERRVRAARFIYFFLSFSLSLSFSFSLSLSRRSRFSRPTLRSLSLSSRGLSPFDIFVSPNRDQQKKKHRNPKAYALEASRNRRTSNNRCRRDGERENCRGHRLWWGAGSRLYPLTKTRSKPAVPIGGSYRLIDGARVSNRINCGINKVYILTQFNSASLNRHLAKT